MIRFRSTCWWRWMIPIAACVQYILVYGCLYNYSILFVRLKNEFESGAVLAGWPGSLSNALACLASPITAVLLQRLRSRTVVVLGHVIICAGSMLTSLVPALWHAILTYGVLVGLGTNFVVHAVTGTVLEWFCGKGNFGRANGILVLGSSIGMLAFSPLMSSSFDRYGWRRTLRWLSGGILALGVCMSVLLTDAPESADSRVDGRSDEGGAVVGTDPGEREGFAPTKEAEASGSGSPTETARAAEDEGLETGERLPAGHTTPALPKGGIILELGHMVTHMEPLAWTIGASLSLVGWTFFIIHFASFMDGRGLSSDRIPVVIMFFAVGEIGGKILICFIGDRFPCQRVYVLAGSMIFATAALGCMIAVRSFPQMVALSMLSGLIRSALYGTSNAVTADLFMGSYSSNGVMVLAIFPYGIGMLVGAPLSGGLYDVTGDYTLSLIVIAATFLCSAAAFSFIPLRRRVKSRELCCCCRPWAETRPVQL